MLVSHWVAASCRFQPFRPRDSKKLPTPSLPAFFYSHGQQTQTSPGLAIKALLFGLLVVGVGVGVGVISDP